MILYSNNASTTLASGISNSDTTIVVATGTGSLFPTISSVDDYFNVTLTDSSKHIEIVTVTARTGDTFTVMRGMENTTARAWLASDILELRITKGLLDQLKLDATKDTASNLSAHTSNTSNPHSVTATQVGLGNVTNESKATMFTSPTFTGTVSGVTASMVGLGNVENKSSATIRGEITSSNVTTALGYTPYNSTNPSGYIAGITSGMVTTALGFTPLSTTGTAADSDTLDGQHGSYYQPASTAITTSNIGSQSVSYASSAGNADTLDGQHGSYYQPASSAITTSNIGSQSVNYSNSTGSVPWSGVSSRPTAVSSFSNDRGYMVNAYGGQADNRVESWKNCTHCAWYSWTWYKQGSEVFKADGESVKLREYGYYYGHCNCDCNCCCCFATGTLVRMADGTAKPIDKIAVGEKVAGFSSDVTVAFKMDTTLKSNSLFLVNGNLEVTGGHLFKTSNGWKALDMSKYPNGQFYRSNQIFDEGRLINVESQHKVAEIVSQLRVGDFVNGVEIISIERKNADPCFSIYNMIVDGGDGFLLADGYAVDGFIRHACGEECK